MHEIHSETAGVSLGVDGGAGALKFAMRDADGVVAHYECAGANPLLIGMNEFLSRLSQGIHDALGRAGYSAGDVEAAGLALSGVDRPAEISLLRDKIPALILPKLKRLWIGNDALAALRQGAGRLRGLVLIAGTGSICFAVAANGQTARVGGWGSELGDEGSGFWIGRRGLQSACRMADGRIAKSAFLDRILRQLRLGSAGELIPWVSGLSREEFKKAAASLYRLVAEESAAGDPSARQAVMLGIGHLVQHAIAGERLLRKLELRAVQESDTLGGPATVFEDSGTPGELPPLKDDPKTELVCAGGLFLHDETFYETFVHQLKRARDSFDPIRLTEPASLGALSLGQEAAMIAG